MKIGRLKTVTETKCMRNEYKNESDRRNDSAIILNSLYRCRYHM